jgi:hypothetical protein
VVVANVMDGFATAAIGATPNTVMFANYPQDAQVSGGVTFSATNNGTWSFSNSGGNAPVTRYTPGNDVTGAVIYGTNAANTVVNWSIEKNGQFVSNAPTGVPPISVSSSTPAHNLTASPTLYDASGTQLPNAHIVKSESQLSGTSLIVTLAGASAFASSKSYVCTCQDLSDIGSCRIINASGSQLTVTGVSNHTIGWICVGN